ncbi:hypothetical protein [Megasphaera vaginalis (ex Bordigoni et al. 2020)]|nr:hypothetical protein [Megasphaera vaginalis (ex Bordigoni et al. 2020)]
MELFDLDNLKECEFAYVAGHRVKVSDLDEAEVSERMTAEAEANYRIRMEQLWGTKSINLNTEVVPMIEFPVLLPVYYLISDNIEAAVNGQTGKVSVLAEKYSSYLSVPWWLQGIVVLLVSPGATFSAILLGGLPLMDSIYLTGVLGFFYLLVFACMFQDGGSTAFGFSYYKKIFNSGEQTYHRENGKLVINDKVLKRRIEEPVFMHRIDGRLTPVSYTVYSAQRTVYMALLSVVTVFFPVIATLLINEFDFDSLELSGSAVWFYIAVPVVPIVLVRYGIQWLYENPWIYIFTKDGRRKRYRKKIVLNNATIMEARRICMTVLFVPPFCLPTWVMIVMIYLAAFGFDSLL